MDKQYRKIPVEVVRKWYPTVLGDLCLPEMPIIVHDIKREGTGFVGNQQTSSTGYLGFTYQGISIGSMVGGETSTDMRIVIAANEENCELDYLYILLFEARKAWHFFNDVPSTEKDCDQYAQDFICRIQKPNRGTYSGNVDYYEHLLLAASDKSKNVPGLAIFFFITSLIVFLPTLYSSIFWKTVTADHTGLPSKEGPAGFIFWAIFSGILLLVSLFYIIKDYKEKQEIKDLISFCKSKI